MQSMTELFMKSMTADLVGHGRLQGSIEIHVGVVHEVHDGVVHEVRDRVVHEVCDGVVHEVKKERLIGVF